MAVGRPQKTHFQAHLYGCCRASAPHWLLAKTSVPRHKGLSTGLHRTWKLASSQSKGREGGEEGEIEKVRGRKGKRDRYESLWGTNLTVNILLVLFYLLEVSHQVHPTQGESMTRGHEYQEARSLGASLGAAYHTSLSECWFPAASGTLRFWCQLGSWKYRFEVEKESWVKYNCVRQFF